MSSSPSKANCSTFIPGRAKSLRSLSTSGVMVPRSSATRVPSPEVEELRQAFGLPGMKVLQFAFDGDPDNSYLPENHEPLSVVYTGTHDNDTTVGWWESQDTEVRANARKHTLDPDEPMPWALIRLAMDSTARLAVVPAQDLLSLGSETRMNTPGSDFGNWSWRADPGVFDAALALRVRALAEEHHRVP